MFKKKKNSGEILDVDEKPYAGYYINTEILSKKDLNDISWETTGTVTLRRSEDLEKWERYSSSVKAIDPEYQQALVTVLRSLNAIIADVENHEFRLETDVTKNPN